MKKLLAIFAICSLSTAFASAEDKGTEFKFGGEIRQRFTLDNNPTFLSSNGTTESNWQQRNQFHVNAISGDKLQAYFNFMHSSIWGGSNAVGTMGSPYSATSPGAPSGAGATLQNALQVHEAWMWWKVSDMFSTKTGRMSMNYGDGLVMSKNDWMANPYNVEGAMGRFSWDFLDLDVGGGKLGEAGTAASMTDMEVVFYGAYAAFKNLPDFFKAAELFVLQVNGDSGTGPASAGFAPGMGGTGAWNLTNIGLHAKGDFAIVDYRLDGNFQSGKQKAATDVTFNGWMADAEVGVNFPEFMKGRVYASYHTDTGDDVTTAANEGYQPLFYDQHRFTGMMNVFGFGNLTNIRAGFTVSTDENCTYGIEANMASRTTANGLASTTSAASGNMFTVPPVQTATTTAAALAAGDKALGTEIDLWAKHNYGHGFTMMAGVGYLTMGNYYKPTGGVTISGVQNVTAGSAYQFVAQAQYNF